MSYLYITENGANFSIDGGYFVVKHKDGMLQKIPKETLESVAVFGNVNITTPCMKELLERGICMSYFSSSGSYFGRLISTRHVNVFRNKKQVYLSDDESFRLEFTKKILKAKINNQIVLVRRYQRNSTINVDDRINEMTIALRHIEGSTSVPQCMGYEGTVSRIYFSVLSSILPEDFWFKGRSKMPPLDAFNSLISLGYTLLMYEIYGEIENKGLCPYVGFMHSDRERHPTLASDLMEEWRAVIVDSTVMSLIMGNEIGIENFTTSNERPGVFLDRVAMKVFLKKYDTKLRNENNYLRYSNTKMSYRRALWYQVAQLTKSIENRDLNYYEPVVIR